jgi:Domain of unknown function (DUF4352)
MPPQQEWQGQLQSHTPPPIQQTSQPQVKPQTSSGKVALWLTIGIFIGLAIGYAIGHGTVYTYTTSPASQQSAVANDQPTTGTSQPTSQPTTASPPTTFSIGETASNDRWSVTLNSVKSTTSGPYAQAGAEDVFLVVDVTVENLSSSPQLVSSGASFVLKDDTGQVYNEKVTGTGVPPATTALQPNDKLRGQISYEVPRRLHHFTFQFQGSMLDASAATWVFTI